MAIEETKIYIHVVYAVGHLNLDFNIMELRKAPCHTLTLEEYNEKLLCIKFKPCIGTTEADVVAMHINKLRKKYKVQKIQVLSDISDYRQLTK